MYSNSMPLSWSGQLCASNYSLVIHTAGSNSENRHSSSISQYFLDRSLSNFSTDNSLFTDQDTLSIHTLTRNNSIPRDVKTKKNLMDTSKAPTFLGVYTLWF